MKSLLTILLLGFSALTAFAQDVIVHRDGQVVVGKVLEIDNKNIHYTKADNPNGPTYTVPLSDILSVRYENGTVEKFGETEVQTRQAVEVKQEEQASLPELDLDEEDEDEEDEGESWFKFRPEVHIRVDESLTKRVSGGCGAEFVAGFQLTPSLTLGPGVGFLNHTYDNYFDDDLEVPVFFQVRYCLGKKAIAPYIVGQFGDAIGGEVIYDAGIDNNAKLDLFFNVGLGCNVRLKRGNLLFDVCYRYQNLTLAPISNASFFGATIGYAWGK